jgi:hypothetical protein
MLALRWLLGAVIVVLGGGFLLLCVVASGFRKSFGASELGPLIVILPIVALAILFSGVLFPHARALLHVGAISAVGLIGFCIWQILTESAIILLFGIAYLITWLAFYWLTISKS